MDSQSAESFTISRFQQANQKGTVAITNSKGWLRFRFSYKGKRHYISMRLQDTAKKRKLAEAKAKLIEADIAYEQLDPTLNRYSPYIQIVLLDKTDSVRVAIY
ncbi:MAG: DUF3596 domain-containing protein [Leptolyngbya sp. BL-A-14]